MKARNAYTPLRRRDDFRRLHAQGRRKGDALLQVRVLAATTMTVDAPFRMGILTTKKYGSAVERNRFRRLVREAIRLLAPELAPGWEFLVLPRDARDAKMPAVLASLRYLLSAAGVPRRDDTVANSGGLPS